MSPCGCRERDGSFTRGRREAAGRRRGGARAAPRRAGTAFDRERAARCRSTGTSRRRRSTRRAGASSRSPNGSTTAGRRRSTARPVRWCGWKETFSAAGGRRRPPRRAPVHATKLRVRIDRLGDRRRAARGRSHRTTEMSQHDSDGARPVHDDRERHVLTALSSRCSERRPVFA